MNEKRSSTDDVLALVMKLLLAIATIATAVFIGIKLYEKIQSNRMCSLCDCYDDEYYDDDDWNCDDCDTDESFAETVANVTENEINPTEN